MARPKQVQGVIRISFDGPFSEAQIQAVEKAFRKAVRKALRPWHGIVGDPVEVS